MASHIEALKAQLEREQTSVNELSLANQELHERIKALEDALKFYVEDDECKYGKTESGLIQFCDDDENCRWCKGIQALEVKP
jgi:hypothetical protein